MSLSIMLGSILLAPVLFGAAGYTSVAIPANNCIQTSLVSTFPEGLFIASITFDVAIPHVTQVFTLMNAYSPAVGAEVATIEFAGSGGATQTFPLVAGQNIRDFFQGSFANTLNNRIPGVHAVNAFECVDPTSCLGAGETGNVNTGYPGTYVLDEQEFSLPPAFASQTLARIVIKDTHNGSVPIILGITTRSQ